MWSTLLIFRMKPRLSGWIKRKRPAISAGVQRHLESLGEVESVAFVRFPPTLPPRAVPAVPVLLPGPAPSAPDEAIRVLASILVTPGFFETLTHTDRRGRAFDARDSQSGGQSRIMGFRSWLRGCGLDTDPDRYRSCLSRQASSGALMRSPTKSLGVTPVKGVRPGGVAPGPSLFRADWASAVASGACWCA